MRAAPFLAAFALAGGLIGFSTVTGQPPAEKAEKSPAAELAKLRGDWVITKVEIPSPLRPVPPEALKVLTIQVRDDRVTAVMDLGMNEPRWEYGLLKVDATKSPHQIDLIQADEKHTPRGSLPTAGKSRTPLPPEVTRAIYRFEGDTFVVAFPTESVAPRPTEFKVVPPKAPNGFGADRSGVGIAYLTKKK